MFITWKWVQGPCFHYWMMISLSNIQLSANQFKVLLRWNKMLFLFSANLDFIFGKNAPCQLLRLNFKNKSDFFNYDFSFNPFTPGPAKTGQPETRCYSWTGQNRPKPAKPGLYQVLFQSGCIERAGSREKVTSSTHEFNFSMCEPTLLVCCTRFYAFRTKFCCFAYQITWLHTLKN